MRLKEEKMTDIIISKALYPEALHEKNKIVLLINGW